MSRFIDAEVFAERLLNAWTTADKEKKFEIVAILSDIVTPILAGTPTADVAPRVEVAREIFEEIMRAMERGVAEADKAVINNTSILDFRESLCRAGEMYAGYIGVAICKVFQKYTEGQK